ncbi:MAG: YdcF family protein [Planctomycetaceae bacterium]
MSHRMKRGALLLVVVLVGMAGFLARESILPHLSSWLNVGESPGCTDHVMILPGDETLRPLVGAAFVRVGLARDVLISQTKVSADEEDGISLPTSEIIRSIVRHRGIPDEKIVSLPGASRTTFDDARALAAYLESRHEDTVTVITNAFHTRRTRYIFQKVLGPKAERLRFVAAPNPGFADDNWWQQRSATRIVLSENLKLAFYYFRYGDRSWWVGIVSVIIAIGFIAWRQRKTLQLIGKPAKAEDQNRTADPCE